MPFIITKKQPQSVVEDAQSDPNFIITERTFRVLEERAVVTLEEAQKLCLKTVQTWVRQFGDAKFMTSADVAILAVNNLTESGGTVGPLPDGTVIEVEPERLIGIGAMAGLSPGEMCDMPDAEIIAAFNAKRAE
jgi:predicted TIM-barrel enzyme